MTNQEAIKVLNCTSLQVFCLCKVAIDGKMLSMKEALGMGLEALKNQKTGHWVKDGDSYSDLYDYKIRCHCSICGNEKFFIDRKTTGGTPCIKNCDNVDKYCSYCGAKMEGE